MKPLVLVTGGAGYIGAILCEHLLRKKYRVLVVDKLLHHQPSLLHLCANPDFEFILGDVRDEALLKPLLKKADVIIPLAAVVGAPACEKDPWLAESVNLRALRWLSKNRSPRQLIIYPNTNSGYGAKSGETFCTEESPLEPISLYGRLKVQAEKELLQSPNVITLRLATVFGVSPRMRIDLLVNHFVHSAFFDRYIVIFEKDFKRNYIHIRDVADCFLHCIENSEKMTGKAYNAGLDGANYSKAQLAEIIKKHIPDFHIHYSEIGKDPDKRNYIVSNQRLREAGFEAKRSLEAGISELILAYRMMGASPYKNV